MDIPRYSILVAWSEVDETFLVRLPDWERENLVRGPVTHGETYEQAIQSAGDAIEALVGSRLQHGETLPEPRVLAGV